MRNLITLLSLLCMILTLGACSSSDDDINNSCGVVIKGRLDFEPNDRDGEEVIVTGTQDGNILTLRETGDDDLLTIVLHGLGTIRDEGQLAAADSFIRGFIGQQGTFFRAVENCFAKSGGLERLIPGQLFLEDGTNVSEELLLMGLAVIDSGNECRSNLIEGCQQGLLIEGAN